MTNTETKKFRPYTVADYNAGKKPIYNNGDIPVEVTIMDFKNIPPKLCSLNSFGSLIIHNENGDVKNIPNDAYNLVTQCENREYWINRYKNSMGTFCLSCVFKTEDEAIHSREFAVTGTIFIGDPVKIYEEYI